jgi:hypothetical protein
MRESRGGFPTMSAMNAKMIGMLIFGLAIGYSSGCRARGIEHVTPEQFQALVKEGQIANTAHWTQPIGATQKRAYVEQGDMVSSTGAPRLQVLWTEAGGLPEGYLAGWDSLDQVGAAKPGSAVQNLLDKVGSEDK